MWHNTASEEREKQQTGPILRGCVASRGQERNFDEHLQTSSDFVLCRDAGTWSNPRPRAPLPEISVMSLLGSFRAEQLIQDLSSDRNSYLRQKVEEAGGLKNSLDQKLYDAVKDQASEAGLEYREGPAY